MEGLVSLLILFWVFKAVRKALQRQAPYNKGSAAKPAKRPKPHPAAAPIQAAQPAVKTASWRPPEPVQPVQGSMSYASQEGLSSEEGEDTCDPALGHESVPHDDLYSLYAQEIDGAGEELTITPRSLIQSVVMSEVLKRPSYGKGRLRR